MLSFSPAQPLRRVLAIGCHADDIEIGCGGTLIALARANPDLEIDWVVLAAEGDRAAEARASAEGAFGSSFDYLEHARVAIVRPRTVSQINHATFLGSLDSSSRARHAPHASDLLVSI